MNREDVNAIQKSVDQIGLESVQRYLPKGMKLHPCDIHGNFLAHYKDANPLCPLCQVSNTKANGTDASDVELYINVRDAIAPASNPHE